MKTEWCENQENPSDRISHAWAPLNYTPKISELKTAVTRDCLSKGAQTRKSTDDLSELAK